MSDSNKVEKEYDRVINEAKAHSDTFESEMIFFEDNVKRFVERHTEAKHE